MFEENEKTVTEEVTENVDELATEELVDGAVTEEIADKDVEQPTEGVIDERTEKKYSDADLDEILAKKIARKESKIRKEYDKKYGKLENTLKAGTGKENLDEITKELADFYTERGIEIPQDPYLSLSDEEQSYLADKEASNIIDLGINEVIEETERLTEIGLENLSPKEKKVFVTLANYRKNEEEKAELKTLGVDDSILKDTDFTDFIKKLNPDLSLKEKYDLYSKMNPKKDYKKMGSMKSEVTSNTDVKDFYTIEEARKFTEEDLKKNPKLEEAIEKSMLKW